ncbi:MAG TPA: hypothetical protein VFZ85_18520 [Jiangellaceae bacterium]
MQVETEYAPAGVQAGPRATLSVLRATAVLHAMAVVLQPVLAGMYLGGDVDAIGVHGGNASLVTTLAFVQVLAAILYVWPGGGRLWPLGVSVAVFMAEVVQIGMGYSANLPIHIPLGVTIIVSQWLLTVWALRSGAKAPRTWGRRR